MLIDGSTNFRKTPIEIAVPIVYIYTYMAKPLEYNWECYQKKKRIKIECVQALQKLEINSVFILSIVIWSKS